MILMAYFIFEGVSFASNVVEINSHTSIYSETEDKGSFLATFMFLEKDGKKYTDILAEAVFEEEKPLWIMDDLKAIGIETFELQDDSGGRIMGFGEFTEDKPCAEIALPNLKRGKICLE